MEEAKPVEYGFWQKSKKGRARVTELCVGLTSTYAIDMAFDYLLYPFVIYQLGVIKGGLVMTALAALANIIALRLYDWSKRDWLGIEAIKSIKEYQGKSRIGRLTAWVLRKSDPVALLFLSIKEDAFKTVIFLRHGSHQYNGMSRRDWGIFLASLAIANIYWTLLAFTGISLAEWAWKLLKPWLG